MFDSKQVKMFYQNVEFDVERYSGSVFIREALPFAKNRNGTSILLIHGSTLGSVIWDIGIEGYSLMSSLANKGYRVFSFDIPGFSRSSRPIGELSGNNCTPSLTAKKLLPLLDCIVDWVRAKSNQQQIVLGGGSWGTVVATLYSCNEQFQRKVKSLILYAPLYGEHNQKWLNQYTSPGNPPYLNWKILSYNGTSAYRLVTKQAILDLWNSQIPSGKKWRKEAVSEALINEEITVHQEKDDFDECASFLAPNGPLLDLFKIFSGRKLYDPSLIYLPTLIIRGDHDMDSTHSDAFCLFNKLGSEIRQYKVIGNGTHFMFCEKNAWQLHREVDSFLRSTEYSTETCRGAIHSKL